MIELQFKENLSMYFEMKLIPSQKNWQLYNILLMSVSVRENMKKKYVNQICNSKKDC